MRYQNAEHILPAALLEEIRQYADGQILYVPHKGERRKQETPYRRELVLRDRQICQDRQNGCSVEELAKRYYLSEKSIQRILRQKKKEQR